MVIHLSTLSLDHASDHPGPSTTIAPAFVRAHPAVCLAVHTLLTSQDLVHIIHDLQDPTDDRVDLEFGRWLQSELGEERRPSIERLVRRLATLTVTYIIGMTDINADEPDSVLNVFSQRPSGLALPLHHIGPGLEGGSWLSNSHLGIQLMGI